MAESDSQIGYVTAVNPSRRELRVKTRNRYADRFENMAWIGLVLKDGESMRCRVESARFGDGSAIVALRPGVTRDNVARLKGAAVSDPGGSGGPPVGADLDELEGLRVETLDGTPLGDIATAFETKAHGVLEIDTPDGGKLLLPATKEVIDTIDLDSGKVVVRDIAPFAVYDDDDTPQREA